MKYGRNPAFKARKEGDKLVLFDPRKYKIIELNSTAALLYNQFSSGKLKEDVVTGFCSLYSGVSREQIESDVSAFLSLTLEKGILREQKPEVGSL